MIDAFDRYDVWRVYIDPLVDRPPARWSGGRAAGEKRVLPWYTNRLRQTALAVRGFTDAVGTGAVSHDGDKVFAQHLKNARKYPLNVLRRRRRSSLRDRRTGPARRGRSTPRRRVLSWEARSGLHRRRRREQAAADDVHLLKRSRMADLKPQSPEWWLQKQRARARSARQPHMQLMDDYYCGDHPLPFLTKAHEAKMTDEFRQLLEDSQSNFMGSSSTSSRSGSASTGSGSPPRPIRPPTSGRGRSGRRTRWTPSRSRRSSSAREGRLLPVGLVGQERGVPDDRCRGSPPDDRRLRARQQLPQARRRAEGVDGREHRDAPRERLPARRDLQVRGERRAEADKSTPATRTLPPRRSSARRGRLPADEFVANPLGVVPIIPLRNRPRILDEGESELADVFHVQNQINGFLFLLALAGYFGAHKQRWAVGLKIMEDENGRPSSRSTSRRDKLWVEPARTARTSKFGEFSQTDLVRVHQGDRAEGPPHRRHHADAAALPDRAGPVAVG
jgi:hypothetical protein